MARHFHIRNAFVDNLTLPGGRYVAFCLGPDSHHDAVQIDYAGRVYTVTAEGWTMVVPADDAPEVVPIHPTWLGVNGSFATAPLAAKLESRVHIVAATCLAEVAAKPPPRPAHVWGRWVFSGSGTDDRILTLPVRDRGQWRFHLVTNDTDVDFRGQSWDRAGFSKDASSGSVFGIYGSTAYRNVGTPYNPVARTPAADPELEEVTLDTLSTTGAWYGGGTDSAERWDTLSITAGTGSAWNLELFIELVR